MDASLASGVFCPAAIVPFLASLRVPHLSMNKQGSMPFRGILEDSVQFGGHATAGARASSGRPEHGATA
jgi:hypothetical protein